MNEYKNVKLALCNFILAQMADRFRGHQVFRAPPRATDITDYPVVIIRSATVDKRALGGDGPTLNHFNLLTSWVTRGATSVAASDELDDLVQAFDNQVASANLAGLDASLATAGSKWHYMSRLDQPTTFDNAIEDQLNWITYSATLGLLIVEKTTLLRG